MSFTIGSGGGSLGLGVPSYRWVPGVQYTLFVNTAPAAVSKLQFKAINITAADWVAVVSLATPVPSTKRGRGLRIQGQSA